MFPKSLKLENITSSKDERISLEMGRIYKIGYIGMVISVVVSLFYGMMVDRVVIEYGLMSDGIDQSAVPAYLVLAVGAFITASIMLAVQTGKGIADDSRHAEAEVFPLKYYFVLSVVIGIVLAASMVVVRIAAEGQLLGINNIHLTAMFPWAGVTAACMAAACLFLSFLSFRQAKKARDIMLGNSEDD